jgi:hypothetical protein
MKLKIARFIVTLIIYVAIKVAVSIWGFEPTMIFLVACLAADVFINQAESEREEEKAKKEEEKGNE